METKISRDIKQLNDIIGKFQLLVDIEFYAQQRKNTHSFLAHVNLVILNMLLDTKEISVNSKESLLHRNSETKQKPLKTALMSFNRNTDKLKHSQALKYV